MSDRVSNCSKVGSASKASHQILYGYLSIAQDGPQPARTQDFASVDRNNAADFTEVHGYRIVRVMIFHVCCLRLQHNC
jgi:hypothetical protein